ncbi:hypothetical protein UPYG_G00057430 [Umbra pygmaea]|uniref:Uncharacterized protein n=1 Tax=Umbra pygmaea TaxID=75934 RepID=A0ABD0XTH1_UMBPY
MSSLNYSPSAKEDVCWTEEQGLWPNIVVKEEEKEVTVTEEEDAFRLKVEVDDDDDDDDEDEEENAVLGVRAEGGITVILKQELEEGAEEQRFVVINSGERADSDKYCEQQGT